ncbi:hypothetical protein LDENG_00015260 [Lucifuga dentata]|nr:hypothetical protein LDENG_00015260 [Lucifuga dentata]
MASARLLFAFFSSAFNSLKPHNLAGKLLTSFSLEHQFILWITDFLTHRSQRILVNGHFSDLLFTDNDTVLSLLSEHTQDHSPALTDFIQWCHNSCLDLNSSKTKEMVIQFSQ